MISSIAGISDPIRIRFANRIKPPFSGARFALALAGIRRLAVQIKAVEEGDFVLFANWTIATRLFSDETGSSRCGVLFTALLYLTESVHKVVFQMSIPA